MSEPQKWTRTDEDGHERAVFAEPARVENGERIYEISDTALDTVLAEIGFVREVDGRESREAGA